MATEPQTKKDYALEAIRALIINGELDPGERLRQGDLATKLNMSLTPVREALRQLEAEGLVAGTAHRGVRVRSIELAALRNVYLSRRLVEPYLAGRGVLNVTDAEVERARGLLRDLSQARAKNPLAVRRANYDFHFCLYEKADAPLLLDMVNKLWMMFPWDVLSVVPKRMKASAIEHRHILEAMIKRDPHTTSAACARHLAQSYVDIAQYLSPEQVVVDPFPFDAAGSLPRTEVDT